MALLIRFRLERFCKIHVQYLQLVLCCNTCNGVQRSESHTAQRASALSNRMLHQVASNRLTKLMQVSYCDSPTRLPPRTWVVMTCIHPRLSVTGIFCATLLHRIAGILRLVP